MAHHPVDLFLCVLPDVRPLRDAPADHFMVVLTVRFLIGGVWIAVEHTGSWISLPVTLDRPRVGELAAVVRKEDGKEILEDIRPEFQIQPFKEIDDRL